MPNPYVGQKIQGSNSPAIQADKNTYTAIIDLLAESVDKHDHSVTKGTQIPTAGIIDGAITTPKLAAGAVATASLADLGVTTIKLADLSVTLAKLAAATISSLIPTGFVTAYAGDSAPALWLLCDGSAVSRAIYTNLFALVGTRFGQGDGALTFNVPDLRGRFIRGTDTGATHDPDAATRTAMNPGGAVGDLVGSLQTDQLKSHNHADAGHAHGYADSTVNTRTGNFSTTNAAVENMSDLARTTATSYANIQATGGTETRPVNAGMNYIIKA